MWKPTHRRLSSLRFRLLLLVLVTVVPAWGLMFYTAAEWRRHRGVRQEAGMVWGDADRVFQGAIRRNASAQGPATLPFTFVGQKLTRKFRRVLYKCETFSDLLPTGSGTILEGYVFANKSHGRSERLPYCYNFYDASSRQQGSVTFSA